MADLVRGEASESEEEQEKNKVTNSKSYTSAENANQQVVAGFCCWSVWWSNRGGGGWGHLRAAEPS